MSAELIAKLTATVWRAPDDSAVILRVEDTSSAAYVVKGAPDTGPTFKPGLYYRFHGNWQDHPKHGRQFSFACFTAVVPGDRRGVIAYLTSVADCVGEKRAERLWERYGPFAVQTLRESPQDVADAGVMPLEEARRASEALALEAAHEQTKVELMGLLSGRGFHLRDLIRECLSRWRQRAPEVIRRNPYALLTGRLPSCGWKRTDRLYLDLGHPPARLKRQALSALAAIRADSGGHTWLSAREVGRQVRAAVGSKADPVRALRLGIRAGILARRKDRDGQVWIADAVRARNEAELAEKVKEVLSWKRD